MFETSLLGMTIEVLNWHAYRDTVIFLRGYRPWATTEDSVVLDISSAVIDLLRECGLGEWHVPSAADQDARQGVADET